MLGSFILRPLSWLIQIVGVLIGIIAISNGDIGTGLVILVAAIFVGAYMRYLSGHTVRIRG
jgi:hypothetical protein